MSDTLNMKVNPGSKTINLIPYAIQAFLSPSCTNVIWSSCKGATAKTISCVEQFKQRLFGQSVPSEMQGSVEPIKVLYQHTTVQFEHRTCTDSVAAVHYVLEEPAIIITLSKDPLPTHQDSVQILTPDSDFANALSTPAKGPPLPNQPPPSRRRSRPARKRKRDVVSTGPSNSNKNHPYAPQTASPSSSSQPTDHTMDISSPSLSYQSPRLAPALAEVTRAFKHSKRAKQKKP